MNPEVVWVDNDDEVRIYHPGTGEFQTLNATAARIWRKLANGAQIDDVVRDLATEFDAQDEHDRRQIDRDVREFVTELGQLGMLGPSRTAEAGR
ncbi:PqqD family protein [Verrucosispora sp. WMMD703]|uniref:PqqD family protein n=1 Tax=Micromonospora TaxID=1873 RepID=UPI00249AA75F|nr:PqqD family protein [Verrucosispora sp. WMMD1129]WFE45892.1 PqqD family protein [Verrucosispora sp. WMMD1129]